MQHLSGPLLGSTLTAGLNWRKLQEGKPLFEFLKSKVELVDYRGRQIVFVSKSRYTLHKTHTVRVQLQAHKPAQLLDVRVVSSRHEDSGFVYVGQVRGHLDCSAVSGRALRASVRTVQRLSLRGESLRGVTLDLSSHGFSAEVEGPLEVGQQLELEVDGDRPNSQDSGQGGVRVRAEVRWVKFEPGIGGVAGFRLLKTLPSRLPETVRETSLRDSQVLDTKLAADPRVSSSDLRVVKVAATLRGFIWNSQDSTLLVEFKNTDGRTRSVLFPGCKGLEVSEARSGTAVATLVECRNPNLEVATVDDLTSCRYQLRDERGKVVMSLVAQPFQVCNTQEPQRKVVAFRRWSTKKAVGF
jgi:hypothetical protein